MPGADEGFNITFLCCGSACHTALEAAVLADPGRARTGADSRPRIGSRTIVVGAEPPPAREDFEWMYEAAEDHCAWCYERLKPDNPPFGVFARLRNRRRALRAQARQMRAALGPARPAAAGTGERILVVPFGDHDVPGRLAESGSPAALGGFDIGFIVCSAECEAALVAAMEDHRLLSVVH